jgi:N-carbamoyl-L-amino-acid hydrolase
MTATAKTSHTDTAIAMAVAAQRNWVENLFNRLAVGSRDAPGIMRDTYGAGENFAHRLIAAHGADQGLAVSA